MKILHPVALSLTTLCQAALSPSEARLDSLRSRVIFAMSPGPAFPGALASLEDDASEPRFLEDPENLNPVLRAELRASPALFDDLHFGARFAGQSSRSSLPVEFLLDVEGRPLRKAVRVRESETLEYQFREHRVTLSPGVALNVPLANDRAWWTVGGGAGVSFAWYRGSSRSAERPFVAWVESGFRTLLDGGRQYLGISYQYFPLPDASPHRVSVQWGYRWKVPPFVPEEHAP